MKQMVSLSLIIIFSYGPVFGMERARLPQDTPDKILLRHPHAPSRSCRKKMSKHKRDSQDLRRTVLKKQHNNKIAGFGKFFRKAIDNVMITGKEKILLQKPVIKKEKTNYIAAIINYGLEVLSNMPTENDIDFSYLMHEVTD